ncbi:MAG: FMN-binding negative transcriptional regulator [Burkholderiaceae bacterium]|jgi:transcriptional regulator|nr:FMN-binding negative transcriptional regulator [Burkholderiaceae bacterium]
MLYQPAHFSLDVRTHTLALIEAHPLATLVSVPSDTASIERDDPVISHAPLMAVEAAGEPLRLIGHLAAANPHTALLVEGAAVTAIFHGPQGYVSPAWYTVKKAVPTWNYAVVHVRGRVRRIDDSAGKEDLLKALIDRHDAPYHAQWDALEADYREGMKRGIVGFAIEVESIASKFKLSQNRSAADRSGVANGLFSGDPAAQALAAWMRRLNLA